MRQFEKLLVGGIWCIVTLKYQFEEDQRGSPFTVTELKPIQMPNMDMQVLFEGRKAFTDNEWIDALLRSTGMEPSHFKARERWHLLSCVNWGHVAREKAISTKKSAPIVFWSLVVKPPLPTCSTT